MKNTVFSAVIAVATLTAAATANETFEPEDIFNLEYAADPQVSPDGNEIIYVRRSNDIMTDSTRSNLWSVNKNGTDHRPILSGTLSAWSPRWSPDGSRLAYISRSSGRSQIYIRYMDTGQTALITNLQKSPSTLRWSPDGNTIAFTMQLAAKKPMLVKMPKKPKGAIWADPVKYIDKARYQRDGRGIVDPAFTHIFVVPAEGGTARQVTSGDYNHGGSFSWSADSTRIFFTADRHKDWEYRTTEADIWSVEVASGAIEQITNSPGAEINPVLSPDGKRIAYLQRAAGRTAYRHSIVTVMNRDGTNLRTLTQDMDRSASNLTWDKKGKGLYFQYTDRATVKVGYVNLQGKQRTVASGLGGLVNTRPYTSGAYSVASGTVAYTAASPDRPADIAVISGKGTTRITALNEDVLAHKKLGKIHEITYPSSFDGQEIHGWYVTPPDYDPTKPYPVILEIHGGPHASYGPCICC